MNEKNGSGGGPIEVDAAAPAREVIDCRTCGLVQYRTSSGNCRRCTRRLPLKAEVSSPITEPVVAPSEERELPEKSANQQSVEKIGQRIQELRESREMTQDQLEARSKVSRSYLSRIESGSMTPSLATLEKISEGIGVSLNHFFVHLSNGESLLKDPFLQELRPFLRQLDVDQLQSILKCLAKICAPVAAGHAQFRPAPRPQPSGANAMARRPNTAYRTASLHNRKASRFHSNRI